MRIPASTSLLGRPFDERLARLGLTTKPSIAAPVPKAADQRLDPEASLEPESLVEPDDETSPLAPLGAAFMAYVTSEPRDVSSTATAIAVDLTSNVDVLIEHTTKIQMVLSASRAPTFDELYAFTKSAQGVVRAIDRARASPLGAANPKEVVKLSEQVAIAVTRLSSLGRAMSQLRTRMAAEKAEPTLAERKLYVTSLLEVAAALVAIDPLCELMRSINGRAARAMEAEPRDARSEELPESALALVEKLHTEGFAPMLDKERVEEKLAEVARRSVADRGPELLATMRKNYGYSPGEKLQLMGLVLDLARRVTVMHVDLLALATEVRQQIFDEPLLKSARSQLVGCSVVKLPNVHRLLAEIFAHATRRPKHAIAMAASGDTSRWGAILESIGRGGGGVTSRRL